MLVTVCEVFYNFEGDPKATFGFITGRQKPVSITKEHSTIKLYLSFFSYWSPFPPYNMGTYIVICITKLCYARRGGGGWYVSWPYSCWSGMPHRQQTNSNYTLPYSGREKNIKQYQCNSTYERILGSLWFSLTTTRLVKPFSTAWGIIFFISIPFRYLTSELGMIFSKASTNWTVFYNKVHYFLKFPTKLRKAGEPCFTICSNFKSNRTNTYHSWFITGGQQNFGLNFAFKVCTEFVTFFIM